MLLHRLIRKITNEYKRLYSRLLFALFLSKTIPQEKGSYQIFKPLQIHITDTCLNILPNNTTV